LRVLWYVAFFGFAVVCVIFRHGSSFLIIIIIIYIYIYIYIYSYIHIHHSSSSGAQGLGYSDEHMRTVCGVIGCVCVENPSGNMQRL
jgi:hypothetical protein